MADEDKKKSSLTGRGREIMGGTPEDRENEAAEEEQSGSWLPRADEGEDETPEFADEEAVLKWMDVDPEEHRPTVRPDTPLVSGSQKRATGELYPVPDFDAIFAESGSQEEPQPEPQQESESVEEGASLEGIFAEEDSSFDDLFGDVVDIDDEPISKPVTLPDTDTQELPLYPASRFEAEDVEDGIATSELDDILQDRSEEVDEIFQDSSQEMDDILQDSSQEVDDDGIPQPEEARDGIIVDDFGDEPAPRATRRSPVLRDFETGELPELSAEEESTDDWEEVEAEPEPEPEPELARASFDLGKDDGFGEDDEPEFEPEPEFESESESEFEPEPEFESEPDFEPEPEFEPESDYDPEPADDWVEAPEPESFGLGEATAILDEEFDEDDRDADTAEQGTFDLLAEMTEDIDEAEMVEDAEPEASAFVAMLERETAIDIAEEIDEETESESEPVDEPEMSEADASEERISEMVEREVATLAMEEPMEVIGIEEVDRGADSMPFALPPAPEAEDTQIASPTEPLEEPPFGQMPAEEAMPLGEEERETVNLRMAALQRNVLDTITPKEPETLSGDQIPTDLYEDEGGEYPAEVFEEALESAGAEPLGELSEQDEGYDDEYDDEYEEELTRTGMMVPAPQQPDPFGERAIRRPAREIFQPGSVVPDQELLRLFVDDNRLRELFELIEALQEEIVENVRGERRQTDTYQEELLEASNLLMQSRENYDEARAIVYRVRADLNRERRVDEDIRRFRPLINNIYIGMGIFVAVLAGLGELFISVADSVGVPWIGQGYYPALAGAVGALLFGWRTLSRHTTVYRDFDPSHVDWYIMNPLLGMVSGFLLYLFLLATSVTSVSSTTFEINGARPLILLAAVAVGYNQNVVISLLDSARQRLAPGDSPGSSIEEPRREER